MSTPDYGGAALAVVLLLLFAVGLPMLLKAMNRGR